MRLFLISLPIALAFLYPQLAELQDWDVPSYIRWLNIPGIGLGYMVVFFHELGHTVTSWTYGQPAVPSFNFGDGGGVSVPLMDRTWVLQAVVYAGFGWLGWQMFRERLLLPLALFVVFCAVHLYFAFGEERYLDPISFMGNGGAAVMGCYCIWRSAANHTYSDHSPVLERYVNMIFGLYAVGYVALLGYGIAHNEFAREAYLAGIGGHITNDYTAIAIRHDSSVIKVAQFSLVFVALCCAATVAACLIWRGKKEREF